MSPPEPTSEADKACSQKNALVLEAYYAFNEQQDLVLGEKRVLQARWPLNVPAKICIRIIGIYY